MDRAYIILFALSSGAGAGILGLLWKWDVVRPGSFPPKKQRDVAGVSAAVWLLGAMLVYLAQFEGALLTSRLPASVMGEAESLRRDSLVSLGGYGTALCAGVALLILLRRRSTERSGLAFRWSDVGRGAAAILMLAPIYMCVAMASSWAAGLVDGAPPESVSHDTLKEILKNRGSAWAWVMGACAIVGAPVVEEIIYRGLLQSWLLRTLERTWPAIIGTSTLFAAMHYKTVPLHAMPGLFVLSVGMGLAYERTRGIGAPIAMHVLFNMGNVALAVLAKA
jgi:membrane protease YdiL (CAAX protease family)